MSSVLYIFSRPGLLIRDIKVIGDTPVARDEIVQAVSEKLQGRIAFIFPRASAFFFPKQDTETMLLTRYPALETVDISMKNFASLIVAISPRIPVAVWCQKGNIPLRCVFVDDRGVAFAEAESAGAALRYPRIDGAAPEPFFLGVSVLSEERLTDFLTLYSRVSELGLKIETLSLDGADIILVLAGGGRVILRDDGEFESELIRLAAILSEQGLVPRRGNRRELRIEYIDLRYGNKIYFKPR